MTPEPAPTNRQTIGVAAAVGLLAVALRLPALGRPSALVFDELFYAPDAADLIRWGSEHGQPAHPGLGKWLIASGISAFGFEPIGWRLGSVVAGALLCAIVAAGAVRATGRLRAGAVAGVLVALDGLVHVTSRLALLDVFVALFSTATVAALVAAWLAQPDRREATRWWWVAAGSLALGVAVKWSMLTMGPLVLVVGWALAGRLEAPGRPRRRRRALVVVGLVVLPPLAILAALAPRQLGPDRTTPADYLEEQRAVARFHRDLRPDNANAAPAWTWVTQSHPANLYRSRCPLEAAPGGAAGGRPAGYDGTCGEGARVARVIAGANPVVWLVGLVGFGWAVVAALRGREVAALLAAAVASAWLPFLASPRDSYSFYAVTLVPLLVLCAVTGLATAPGRARRRIEAVVVVLAAVAFLALWPVWSAQPVTPTVHRWLTGWPGWS